MNIHIRKANPYDLEKIEQIEQTLEHRILSSNILKETIEKDNYYYLVAVINNVCVGYIAAEYLVDHIDILSIAVLSDYRRHSIASMLIKELINIAEKLNTENIFLEVRSSNIEAIRFYEKLGFEKISCRKNYYTDTNENAYIYVKKV